MPIIRNYQPSDRTSWLRCRALAFLDTDYYDDVWPERPDDSQIQLVADKDGQVVGIIDICLDGPLATIDTVCVHPDHRGRGVATALLDAALAALPDGFDTIDAWTREDRDTLAWYHARGFTESEHYLHVYKSHDEPVPDELGAAEPFIGPVIGFFHADLKHEDALRARFRRVYVCRRMSRPVR